MPIFFKSKVKNKKYAVRYNNKIINFGDSRYTQYKDSTGLGLYTNLNNNDKKRRASYIARASKIKNKEGQLTASLKSSANYYALRYLWSL
tara:strand:+ start:269 stop:538 length:270 start_codon:yes stop_codon:yes gene_type:complete